MKSLSPNFHEGKKLLLEEIEDLTDGGVTTLHKHDHALQDNLNSANYTHLTAVNHTDLTDGGNTTLHSHRTRAVGVETAPGITLNGSDIIVDGVGVYWVNNQADFAGDMVRATPAGNTFTIPTVEVTYYLRAEYNAGVPILACDTTPAFECDGTCAPICSIIKTGTNTFHLTRYDNLAVGLPNKLQKALEVIIGPKATSGLVIADTGVRYLTISSGTIHFGGIETLLSAVNTSTGDTYRFIYWDGAVWQNVSATQLSNSQYQALTGLDAITGSRYAINWIWRGIEEQKHVYILLGEGNYTYGEAVDSSPPIPPAWVSEHATLLGRILYQRLSDVAIIQLVSTLGYALVGAIQHNNTTNKQGGTTNEYYHLTAAQHTVLSSQWALHRNAVSIGETVVIPADSFLLGVESFVNEGTIDNHGKVIIL